MSLPGGPKLELVEATETEIVVQYKSESGFSNYELQYKEVQAPWEAAKNQSVTSSGDGKSKATASDLTPGTSYCLRLVVVGSGGNLGSPGPELYIDTEQVGCTPKQKSKCVIL